MIRFLADEDFNNDILRGLRRRDSGAHSGAGTATLFSL
jgi:hypothetical protein